MPNGSKGQILIVDDEPSVRETLELLLMSVGYDVAVADNGVSAVAQLNKSTPHLIVTDLNMPKMSGMELISHVRSRYPGISIVAMSGEYHGDAIPAGIMADRFYAKGQHPHNLLTTIATLIAATPACNTAHEDRPSSALDS